MDTKSRKKYLVTGGAGFIGSNIAKQLEADGHEVTVLDNFSKTGHFKNLIGFKGNIITADLFEYMPSDMYFDAIFHEAALTDTTVTDQKMMMEQNVEAFKNVLAFAAENEIKKVIYASSSAVYGNNPIPNQEKQDVCPENIYGFSKAIMENVAHQFAEDNHDMKIIGLRYFNVYGPGEFYKGNMASIIYQLYKQMKAGQRPRIFKQGEQQRDFIYIKDIVKINLCALAKGKETAVYNAATSVGHTFNTIVECLNKAMGTHLEPEYIENPHPFFQLKTQADISLAKEKLGYEPDYSLEKGIAEYVAFLEANK